MTLGTTTPALDSIRPVTADEVDFYRRNGWVKLDALLPAELTTQLLAVAQATMGQDADNPTYSGRGARYAAWTHASADSDWLRSVSQSRELGAVGSTLGGGRSLRWYADTFLAKKGTATGGAETPWHQDLPQHAFDRGGAMTIWIPLVDCPPERGTLRFLSGSHRAGPLGRFGRRADGASRAADIVDVYPSVAEEFPESPPLRLRVGDATVHDALTVHAAPANNTARTRWVYSITWFPAETLYTGASSYHTNGLGLTVDDPFDDDRFPVVA
jgi:ectoine hydroxylase-related dioxygenase (phytanoyl-CoA dioxygenase family)